MDKKQYLSGSVNYNTTEKHVSAPIFKRVFNFLKSDQKGGACDKKLTLRIYAVGFYRLFLNGEELTKGYFAPYISNPNDVVYYDDYDVTESILNGENEICVLLGNGFSNSLDCGVWDFEKASFRAAPKFYLEILKGENGGENDCGNNEKTAEVILNSGEKPELFTVCDSPVTFDDYRCGEHYDARLESKTGNKLFTGINERKPVLATLPKGEEKRCEAQPIKAFERIAPVGITKTNGGYIYDFGVNYAGIFELKINGEAGQKIGLTFGEVLVDGMLHLGNISFGDRSRKGYVQHDEYVCKSGWQAWQPCFTYHGYRYVFVEGITESQATKNLLTYIVLHTDMPARGIFNCDSETINKIQSCTLKSDLSNFFYFPTDCPQREKNGWTGDAALSGEQLLYNFDCESSLKEWLVNISKAQAENGALPGIVPTDGWGFEWGNGPAWDGVIIELPYQLYRFGGDKKILEDNATAIKKYVGYLKTKVQDNGLIGFGLGDWLEAGSISADRYNTPEEVSNTLVCIDLLRKAQFILKTLGDKTGESEAKNLETSLIKSFKQEKIADGVVNCRTQTAQSMAIGLGLFADEEKAYSELLNIIKENGGCFKVGIIGAKWLFDCLCDHGDCDLAFKMVTDDSHPGFAHNIKFGATTLWEDMDFYDEKAYPALLRRVDGGGVASLNHHCWGSISGWFYRRLAGLNIKSESKAEISPCFIKSLNKVSAEYSRGGKKIKVCWARENGKIVLSVENVGYNGTVIFGDEKHDLKQGYNSFVIEK